MKIFASIIEANDYAAENGAVLIVIDWVSVVLYETQEEVPVQFNLIEAEEPIYY